MFNKNSELIVQNLSCKRAHREIFSNINLHVAAGEVWQILGVNGSGKSSLLYILAGLLPAYSGNVKFLDQSIENNLTYKTQLAFLGHKIALRFGLSVLENLQLALRLKNKNLIGVEKILELLNISALKNKYVDELSQGQKQKVALARILLSQASIWILDEPFNAVDQAGIDLLLELIESHAKQGGIAIFTSHQAVRFKSMEFKTFELH